MPGADETEVVGGSIAEVRDEGAVISLREDSFSSSRSVFAVPKESGWGLQALWFSFIAVEVFDLERGECLGRWFIRLDPEHPRRRESRTSD